MEAVKQSLQIPLDRGPHGCLSVNSMSALDSSQMSPIAKHERLHILGAALGKQRIGAPAFQTFVSEHRHAVAVDSERDQSAEVLAGKKSAPLGSVGVVVTDACPKGARSGAVAPGFAELGRALGIHVGKNSMERQVGLRQQPGARSSFAVHERDRDLNGSRLRRQVAPQQPQHVPLAIVGVPTLGACFA